MPTLAPTTPLNRMNEPAFGTTEMNNNASAENTNTEAIQRPSMRRRTNGSNSVACAANMATLHVTNMTATVPRARPSVWPPKRLKPTSNVPVANDAKPASSIDARTNRARTAEVAAGSDARTVDGCGLIHNGTRTRTGKPTAATASQGQSTIAGIMPTGTFITGPASQLPTNGPARKPTNDALPSNTKRRLRATGSLKSAI